MLNYDIKIPALRVLVEGFGTKCDLNNNKTIYIDLLALLILKNMQVVISGVFIELRSPTTL